ncbi:MAG TPA: hypothetical protein DIT49_02635 [Clostridiales bacterium]|nr:hypothetical protein [Clostridiales bacterium]
MSYTISSQNIRKERQWGMKIKRAGMATKVLIVVLLVSAVTATLSLQVQLTQAKETRDLLRQQVEQQQEVNAALADDIANSDNPEYLANVARTELGLLTPGEIEFVDTSK